MKDFPLRGVTLKLFETFLYPEFEEILGHTATAAPADRTGLEDIDRDDLLYPDLYLLGLVLGEGDAELDPLAQAADQGPVVGLSLGPASPHQHDLEHGDQTLVTALSIMTRGEIDFIHCIS